MPPPPQHLYSYDSRFLLYSSAKEEVVDSISCIVVGTVSPRKIVVVFRPLLLKETRKAVVVPPPLPQRKKASRSKSSSGLP